MEAFINFIKENLVICCIVVAVVVLLIVVLAALSAKKKNAKKANLEKSQQEAQPVSDEQSQQAVETVEVQTVEQQESASVDEKQAEPQQEVQEEKEAQSDEQAVEAVVEAEPQAEEVVEQTADEAQEESVETQVVEEKQEDKTSEQSVEQAEEKQEPVAKPKKAPAKKADVAASAEEKPTKKKGAVGKWQVYQKSDDEFVAHLLANNGTVLLTSETYSTAKGVMSGIETIKKNVDLGKFEVHCDKKGNYYYKLKSSANRLLCVGEVYSSKVSCESSIESVKKFAQSAILVEDVIEDKTVIKYEPTGEIAVAKKGYTGKWTVEEVDEMYLANLWASNGELLLVTESYSTEAAAKSAMENIKKNALANNFIIDRDKTGRYYYKLRNTQKSILCVGETYDSVDRCISAIESVKKFCNSAKLVEKQAEDKE
ncbi:MAG: DUF1508 domain-containing protein [Christensenellales bacterium]